jgi:alpha-tubulin suppressor-like RCC1 family protein
MIPAPVAGDLHFTALTASYTHVCGLASGGEAYCWGSNDAGETGTGSTGGSVAAPTAVSTALRFTQISAQGVGFGNSSCGLTAAGEAWCWGDNQFGQLGDGTTTSSAVPVQVESPVPFASIQTGYFHSCGVATTGELWCWGEQEASPGAFGAMPVGLYPTPQTLHEEFRFTQLSPGRNYTCALNTEQAAFCWGSDLSVGSLGQDQVNEGSAVPLPVAVDQTFISISSTTFKETYGLTAEGAVYRWGSPGNDVAQAPPVLLAQLGFLQMDGGLEPVSGYNGACGITSGGAVYCVSDDGVIRGVPSPIGSVGAVRER